MAATPAGVPIGKGFTTSQWETWIKAVVQDNPKLQAGYQGSTGANGIVKGTSWDQVYAQLYAYETKIKTPGITPDIIGEAVVEEMQVQGVAEGIGAATEFDGAAAQGAVSAAIKGAKQAANSIPGVTAISSVEDFLQGLTSANLWIRVAKVTVGGVILIVGLVKLTGVDKAAGGIAAKAVKVAPLL